MLLYGLANAAAITLPSGVLVNAGTVPPPLLLKIPTPPPKLNFLEIPCAAAICVAKTIVD